MKRINESKKMFEINGTIELKQIKSTYRKLVKEWHPDKFQEGDPKAAEAAIKCQQIVDSYHFLISIAPATKEANLEEYNLAINKAGIEDYKHKGSVLEITFTNGSSYEYFGVTKKIYIKLVNADKPLRFAKRHIFNSFIYRKSKKELETT